MNNDNKTRYLLISVILFVFAGMFVQHEYIKRKTEAELANIKQATVTYQIETDKIRDNYEQTKKKNIQKENEVAKNVVQDLCKMYSDDGDALIGWAELVTRAREHNRQWSDSQD